MYLFFLKFKKEYLNSKLRHEKQLFFDTLTLQEA